MQLYELEHTIRNHPGAAGYWHNRAAGELTYALKVSAAHGALYDKDILPAAEALGRALSENGAIVRTDVLAFEETLAPLRAACKAYRLHCAGHAHIDMNWMWGFQETASLTVDTFRTVLKLMEEYPQFRFSQSQASVYRIIEQYAPDMLPEIRQRIAEGRWEVTASTWVEPDKNMPSGESLARHILYTKRYLAELLGLKPEDLQLDFEPDTFGHTANAPEILANGGVKYFYHCRGNSEDTIMYRYRAPSGAEALTFREPHWYINAAEPMIPSDTPIYCAKYGVPVMLYVYGVGDHGGGPTRRDVERLTDMQSWPLFPEIVFSTFHGFFRELEPYREQLPVVEHELNYVFTGCYTSQSRIKMANRVGEQKLYQAEALAAAATLTAGEPAATARFAEAWKHILFNHFHDILPGSGVVDTREYAMGGFQQAMACANIDGNRAMRALAEQLDTSAVCEDADPDTVSEGAGVGYATGYNENYAFPRAERGRGKTRILTLFNPSQAQTDHPTEITVWDWTGDPELLTVTTMDGEALPFQIVERIAAGQDGAGSQYWGHSLIRLWVQAAIPAFGHTVVVVKEASRDTPLGAATRPDPRTDDWQDEDIVLENAKVRAAFQKTTMLLTSLYNKETHTELLDGRGAGFQFVQEDTEKSMTAWRVGNARQIVDLQRTVPVTLLDHNDGAVMPSVTYALTYENVHLEVTAMLPKDAETVEFRTAVRWLTLGSHEKGTPQLRFAAPLAFAAKEYHYDVANGLICRPALGHDVPALSFAAAKCAPGGVALFCDTKYGFRGWENTLYVDLIRGSSDPDPFPELGQHYIRIGLAALTDFTAGTLCNTSLRFCQLPLYTPTGSHSGTRSATGSFLRLPDTLRLSGAKLAEDDPGTLVLRLYDVSGRSSRAVVHVNLAQEACLCDLLEQPGEALATDHGRITLPVRPYGLHTLRVKF